MAAAEIHDMLRRVDRPLGADPAEGDGPAFLRSGEAERRLVDRHRALLESLAGERVA